MKQDLFGVLIYNKCNAGFERQSVGSRFESCNSAKGGACGDCAEALGFAFGANRRG